jgi:hypothetical protein
MQRAQAAPRRAQIKTRGATARRPPRPSVIVPQLVKIERRAMPRRRSKIVRRA